MCECSLYVLLVPAQGKSAADTINIFQHIRCHLFTPLDSSILLISNNFMIEYHFNAI